MKIYKYVCNLFNEKLQSDAIHIDFQKAFDEVNHFILLKKISQIGDLLETLGEIIFI